MQRPSHILKDLWLQAQLQQAAAVLLCVLATTFSELQELGTRCMSAESSERPKFDEVLVLVDALEVNV